MKLTSLDGESSSKESTLKSFNFLAGVEQTSGKKHEQHFSSLKELYVEQPSNGNVSSSCPDLIPFKQPNYASVFAQITKNVIGFDPSIDDENESYELS